MSWSNYCCLLILLTICCCCFCRCLGSSGSGSNILMITMGVTKSHKILFWALDKAPIKRWVSLSTAIHECIVPLRQFWYQYWCWCWSLQRPSDYVCEWLSIGFSCGWTGWIDPKRLVEFIQNYTDWDLVGADHAPLSIVDAMLYLW